jgi:hypothetical protein
MTKRVRVLAVGAGAGVIAVGGVVAKRVLGHREDEEGASAEPSAAAAPSPSAERPAPKPKPVTESPKPKPAKSKPAKPASKPKAAKPKPAKSKPVKPKPAKPKAKTTGTDAPPKPAVEPGNISGDKEPHHALNNPVVDPDETEYPDPFEKREDPRGPGDAPLGDEPHVPTGAESTSEPPLERDLEADDHGRPPRRENLDD